jgi:hypothetical protein
MLAIRRVISEVEVTVVLRMTTQLAVDQHDPPPPAGC